MTKKSTFIIASLFSLIGFLALTSTASAFSAEESGCTRPTEKNSEQIENYKDCIRDYKEKYREEHEEKVRELKREREEKKLELKENIAERCNLTEEKVDEKIEQFRESQAKHLERYEALKEKLANLIARLEENGYDVTELQNDLIVLEEKIAVLSEKFEAFVVQLEETADYECGNSDGNFVAAMKEAKDALAEVRTATLDVKTYYVETVKPDIVALRDQIRETSKEDSRMLKPSNSIN